MLLSCTLIDLYAHSQATCTPYVGDLMVAWISASCFVQQPWCGVCIVADFEVWASRCIKQICKLVSLPKRPEETGVHLGVPLSNYSNISASKWQGWNKHLTWIYRILPLLPLPLSSLPTSLPHISKFDIISSIKKTLSNAWVQCRCNNAWRDKKKQVKELIIHFPLFAPYLTLPPPHVPL